MRERLLLLTLLLWPAPGRAAPPARTSAAPLDQRASRRAATSVLTEHPSSLRLFKLQLGRLRRLIEAPGTRTQEVQRFIDQPLMTTEKQLREFRRFSLERGLATAKMLDYEGKPMPPRVIGRYVRAVERAGLRPGIEGDRFLLLRLPGAAESSEKDRTLRRQVFEAVVDTNLQRVLAGKPLPLDRLIVPDTKRTEELLEVHATYDRLAEEAVDKAIAGRLLPAERRHETLRALRRVQAVPLVEDATTVMNADAMMRSYLEQVRARYGEAPKHLVVFVAGSDLNREIGPVGGQLARTVLRSRLERLQRAEPGVDIIPWVGIGSGAMRSGLGRFPEKVGMVHPGMTATVQPDQLDQKNLGRALAALDRSALERRAPLLSPGLESKLAAVGAIFADVHARRTLDNALSTVRLANLLAPLDQRGRKKSSANLFYEKGGELYLRSAQPKDASDATTYGRSLDVGNYAGCLGPSCAREAQQVARRQRAIDALWPKGLSDPRAIPGAFARYLEGDALTTVAGLGEALRRVERHHGKAELERLRPFVTLLVRNDGFVLTKDRELIKQRLTVLHPDLRPAQIEARARGYFADLAALERYLGRPVEQLIAVGDRTRYEAASRKLFANPGFVRYLQGGDLSLRDWLKVMNDLVPLLSNPSWNRIGLAPAAGATAALA